ncbi:chloramphenicol-sensitive protein RarD [Mycetocola sp. BIGb0189]|uniref:EamA family transporter RarD n=1 Tax=Mycetocola sp. BIGb0189 TaxID=2940604 RepID=UPI00216866CA|nr:EamA family transporter RarD [Mycetocola sp. BIGb0189]MCS4277580.1 chloramphenicol-sensitive protein RarD [Mycetocola sp. BIGb0189]
MTSPTPSESRRGLAYALLSYLIWGILPLYFVLLSSVNPFEIVAWRIVFTAILCALLITVTRTWPEVREVLRRPRMVGVIAAAGMVIYINWQTYVIATTSGYVVEAALGYFVNPVVTILLGVLIYREKLRPTQWFALGMTVVAFVIISIGLGRVPWIALILAVTFGIYGVLKKGIGARVSALTGLFVETILLLPVAAVIIGIVWAHTGSLDLLHSSPLLTVLMIATGITTAAPLLLFASGARRISLTALGFAQYLGPTLMFLIGWLVLGEQLPPERWIGFGIVWLSLVILSVDLVRHGRANRLADAALAQAQTGAIPIVAPTQKPENQGK